MAVENVQPLYFYYLELLCGYLFIVFVGNRVHRYTTLHLKSYKYLIVYINTPLFNSLSSNTKNQVVGNVVTKNSQAMNWNI